MCGKKDFFSLQRQKRKETDTDVVRKLENSQRKLEQTMKRLLFNVFDQVLDALPQGIRESQFSVRVVIAGCTGVGKSSTANALLGTNWKVGHVRATTREIEAKQLVLVEDGVETPSNIEVIDVPGLGESIARDREYIPIYVELLKTCDAMIWLQSANERQMTSTQIYLNKLVTALPDLASRTVIGLNKADLVEPMGWCFTTSLPNESQERNIHHRVDDVFGHLQATESLCKIPQERIVAFSAKYGWRVWSALSALNDTLKGGKKMSLLRFGRSKRWVFNSNLEKE
jgi:hypothetical protein